MAKRKAKPIEGGVDHGREWESLAFAATAMPEEVAIALCDSFDGQWIRELIEALVERGQ